MNYATQQVQKSIEQEARMQKLNLKIFFQIVYRKIHQIATKKQWKSPLLKKINCFLIKMLKTNYVIIGGIKFYLDEQDSLRLSTRGYYEPAVLEIIKRELKEGDVLVEIGAHLGYYTLILSKLVGPAGKIYAFEPDPNNFTLLKKNLEVNQIKNVVLERKAVSNRNGKMLFYPGKERSTHGSLIKGEYACGNPIEVDGLRLDDYPFKEKINLIKMDIEGEEFRALEGMRSLILKTKPLKMISEFSPAFLKEQGINPKNFITELEKVGFHLQIINEEKTTLEAFNADEFLTGYIPKLKVAYNLLCEKIDKA